MEKSYYDCTITTHDGKTVNNPLMKSESHLIAKMARENKSVLVQVKTCTKSQYKSMFGF